MAHFKHAEKSRFEKTPRKWLSVGTMINELANEWSGRDDIITFVGEGAGSGAPACFVPNLAEMEVNVELAFGEGTDPRFIGDLKKRSIQFDYPVAMGAVLHEAMHAKHSRFDLAKLNREVKDNFLRSLVLWFEESRIEARGITQYPKNKAFLRACALRLVLGDLKEDENFSSRGIQAFSQLMLLTLARVDAGVLMMDDVKVVEDAAHDLFDKETYRALRNIWVRAQAHKDDGTYEPLLRLAEEWKQTLEDAGQDTSDPDSVPDWLKELLKDLMGEPQDGEGDGEGQDGSGEGESDGSGSGSGLLQDMADDTESDAQSQANAQAVREVKEEIAAKRKEAFSEKEGHKKTMSKVFGRGTGPAGAHTHSELVKERMPTGPERAAAVVLSKALDRARYRDRVVVKRTSVVPPGKINMRRAIAGAEQTTRGAEVTAEPWSRKQRKHTEDPTLKIGVLVDISGSMSRAMEPMASSAWILSEATQRIQGKCAMVYYGNDVFATLKPGERMKKVKVYDAPDGTEKFDKAFQAIDGSLDLLGSSGARLLVIVSDLYYTGWEGERTIYWMNRCRQAGVAVIVVPFEYHAHAVEVVKKVRAGGVEVIDTSKTRDTVAAAKAIGEAAVRRLSAVSQ